MSEIDRLGLVLQTDTDGGNIGFLMRLLNYLKSSFDATISETDELVAKSKEQDKRIDKLLEDGKPLRQLYPDI